MEPCARVTLVAVSDMNHDGQKMNVREKEEGKEERGGIAGYRSLVQLSQRANKSNHKQKLVDIRT